MKTNLGLVAIGMIGGENFKNCYTSLYCQKHGISSVSSRVGDEFQYPSHNCDEDRMVLSLLEKTVHISNEKLGNQALDFLISRYFDKESVKFDGGQTVKSE